jgi:hypothetical protein
MRATAKHAGVMDFPRAKAYKRHIVWKVGETAPSFLQIYTKGLEYALVSDNYEQVHEFVLCKDFLHDVIFSCINNLPFQIYKFAYSPDLSPKCSIKKLKLLVTNSQDKKFASKVKTALEFINQFEDMLKMPRSRVRECSDLPAKYRHSGIYLFEAHRRWLQAPPLVSLYTLLLRIGFVHVSGENFWRTIEKVNNKLVKPYQKKDAKWLRVVESAIRKIAKYGDRKIFYKDISYNYPRNLHMETVHNRLGILNFSHDMICAEKGQHVIMQYWHRSIKEAL